MRRILYYTWDEVTAQDNIDCIRKSGYEVVVVEYKLKSFTTDGDFVAYVEDLLKKQQYDAIYTVNYVPVISKISFRNKIPYIAWFFDSPCMSSYTDMVFNPYNYLFHIDSYEVEKFRKKGVKNIWYMPLAVNCERVNKLIEDFNQSNTDEDNRLINNDVSFMGSLYNDQYNFYDQIKGITEYEMGYIDGIINSQLMIPGNELIEEVFDENAALELGKFVSYNLEEEFFITPRELMLNMIEKKATIVERREILEMISKRYNLTLYSGSDSSFISEIINKGYLDYYKEMPIVFNNSKINLNITLRGIKDGISLRVMDVLGAGGFLLTNYQNDIDNLFEDGKELVMYYNREDLMNKIEYYLIHEDKRREIAVNGKKKIEQMYSYDVQLKRIFDTVFGD